MTDDYTASVEALMKRCQNGVGGRNALDQAHEIMAECYGTLGKLLLEVQAQRERCAEIARGAQRLSNAGDAFADGWCSAALQIAQAIMADGAMATNQAAPIAKTK
jgi:hypothetical protein